MDKSGWWVAAVLFVLLIFRDLAKKWAIEAIDAARLAVFRWMAGNRFVRSRALSLYRAGVARRYEYVHLPFLDTKILMRNVYVPLAPAAPADALRLVVTGPPGSGKSWLLRHELLTSRDRVPVLCELHRHTGTDLTIEAHVAQQFELSGFPKAQRFVEQALRAGSLAVLLDGFDEVSTADRPRVAEMIKDFGALHPKARLVVTCRTAVYDNQLAPELTQRYAVGEFDERLIRRLVGFWPGIDLPRAEQLMEALRDTPRVMQLARNPLLLTMIACLYGAGDEHRRLPHSRAEFYQEAMDYLLRRLKDATNRFDGQTKRAVLQRLALACLDAPAGSADRLTLPHRSVIDIVSRTLPELNEPAQEAKPMLAEIVERSGLLLAVDGGDRYQFAHLTLQEFLAACELKESPKPLLERYRGDPTRWRECVKLWCGVTDEDCTETAAAVYELDAVLGLECLADARKLDGALADRIVTEMLARLEDSAVVDAFGVVASDPRPRGTAVYERLLELARDAEPGAIDALAATNSAKACAAVAELAGPAAQREDAREALVRMGDLAVPILAPIDEDWAVDGLARIATPAAVEALMLALRRANATRAAWHLAALLREPEVYAVMRDALLYRWNSERAWYWEPFLGDGLHDVAGRIADLLNTVNAEDAIPDGLGPLDPRIGVPLWIEADKPRPLGHLVEHTDAMAAIHERHPIADQFKRLLPDCAATRLLDRLDPEIAYELMYNWFAGKPGLKQDWLQVRRIGPDRFIFDRSPHHRVAYGAVVGVIGSATLFAMATLFDLFTTWGPAWLAAIMICLNFFSLYPLIIDRAHHNFTILARYSLGWIRVGFAIAERRPDPELWKAAVTGTVTTLSFLVVLLNFQLYLGWPAAIGFMAALCAGVATAIRLGMKRRDRWSNPLRRVIYRIDDDSAENQPIDTYLARK